MAVNKASIQAQILAALKNAISGAATAEESDLQATAADLAQTLVRIEVGQLDGTLSHNQAQPLLAATADAAKAALSSYLVSAGGDVAGTAKKAVVAAFHVLAAAALGATGLSWLVPIVNAAADAL